MKTDHELVWPPGSRPGPRVAQLVAAGPLGKAHADLRRPWTPGREKLQFH